MSVSLDLENVVVLGLAAGGLASIVRVGLKHWLSGKFAHLNSEPPIGCPTCMGFWSSLVVMLVAFWFSRLDRSLSWPFQLLSMTAIAAWVNWQVVPVPAPADLLDGFAGADVIVEERHDLPDNQGSFFG